MTSPQSNGQEEREAETAEKRAKEGFGTVPNVTEGQGKDATEELKEAVHELEEEKGDWSKSRG